MQLGQELEHSKSIVKYVPPRLIAEDGTVDGVALLPRPTDVDGSSAHELLFYSNDPQMSLKEIISRFRLRTSKNGAFSEITVGAIYHLKDKLVLKNSVEVVSDPLEAIDNLLDDPAHVLITGLPVADQVTELDILNISECFICNYPTAV